MHDVQAFVAAKNRLWGDQAFVLLLEISYAPGQFIRWARLSKTETSITFEGAEWTNFPFDKPKTSQNARAEIPTFDIPIANPQRVFQTILSSYIVEGRPGRLVIVHREHLSDPTAKIDQWFTVETARCSDRQINLTCKAVRYNPRRARIPSKTMTRTEYPGLLGVNRRRN